VTVTGNELESVTGKGHHGGKKLESVTDKGHYGGKKLESVTDTGHYGGKPTGTFDTGDTGFLPFFSFWPWPLRSF